MEKTITRNFGIDKCYFKYNSTFLSEKLVKWFETSTVYSTSIREALKLKKTINISFVYSYLITNGRASVIARIELWRKKVCYEVQF